MGRSGSTGFLYLASNRRALPCSLTAAWLPLIMINLIVTGGHLDVALRDLGLFLGALALARLSLEHEKWAKT